MSWVHFEAFVFCIEILIGMGCVLLIVIGHELWCVALFGFLLTFGPIARRVAGR